MGNCRLIAYNRNIWGLFSRWAAKQENTREDTEGSVWAEFFSILGRAPPTLRSMPQRQQLHSMAEQGNSCREKKIGIIQCSCHMLDMWPHLNTLTTRSWSMWSRSTFMFLIQALCESRDSSAFRRCSQSLVYENTIFICVCLPTHFACREKKRSKAVFALHAVCGCVCGSRVIVLQTLQCPHVVSKLKWG